MVEKDLENLIINFCVQNFNNIKITGNSLYCNSPFTNDEKQKFVINLKEGYWKCFKTNYSGKNIFSLIEHLKAENVPVNFEFLNLFEENKIKKQEKQNVAQKILDNSQLIDIFENVNEKNLFVLRDYLAKRHISYNKIKLYKLSYIINRQKSFLYIPFFNLENKLVGFQLHNFLKYSDESKYQTFFLENNGASFMFGFNNIKAKEDLYITEGVFDAMQVRGVAKLGANITTSQINFLQSTGILNKFQKVVLLQDNDEVGKKSLKKDYEKLINAFPSLSGKIYFYWWDNHFKDINEQGFVDENKIVVFDNINYFTFLKQ